MSRNTRFPIPKNELYFYNEEVGEFQPIKITEDGRLMVQTEGITLNAGNLTIDNVQSKIVDVDFHTGSTTVSNGTEFIVNAYKDLAIEIYGTSTSRSVVFEATGASGVYKPIQGIRNSDFNTDSQTTGTSESWSFSIAGQKKVRIRITAVAGGNVIIKGVAVA